MFSKLSQIIYQGKFGREYLWQTSDEKHYFSATSLGGTILRVQALRQKPSATTRYQVTDDQEGTLPYHSWSVSKGDEQWPEIRQNEAQARSLLEPHLHEFSFSPDAIRLSHPLADQEHIYGLGERAGSMNKRGQAFPIWNIDPPQHHGPETMTMYTSIPFYLSYDLAEDRTTGVFIDHTGRVDMDLGKSQPDRALSTVKGDKLVVYFIQGPTPEKVLHQYSELTGRMPLPPRWALGHHQARWSYPSEQQVREIAQKLRDGKHPTDAIWLDIDYMDGYRNFTWDPKAFPDPAGLIKDLHQQGLHLITILDPGTKVDPNYSVYQQGVEQDFFCHNPDGSLFVGQVWPGDCHFPDFSRSEVRKWWGDLYKNHLDLGVDGIWNDMDEPALTDMFVKHEAELEKQAHAENATEKQALKAEQAKTYHEENKQELENERWLVEKTMPIEVLHQGGGSNPTGPDGDPTTHEFFHNAYGQEMARSTYEGLLRLRPDQRPFVLTRSGTAGIQRYSAVWTGDNSSRWEHIPMAVSMCLNLGISGVPFVGVDVGGFWGDTNGELLVRFAQLGALLPFYRNHNEISTISQEPWAFGEPYESAYRQATETRYRLLPYIYDVFHEASRSGTPIIRPLYYHFPKDERALDEETTFLLGPNLLSAPVYQQSASSREVYLPEGDWFDFWDGTLYHGNTVVEISTPLDRWPLLVRQNSILPTTTAMQYVDQDPEAPLTFTCYMAGDGLATYTFYQDDGNSLAYQRGEHAEISLSCRTNADGVTVEIEEQFQHYRPRHKHYELVVHYGTQTFTKQISSHKGKQIIEF